MKKRLSFVITTVVFAIAILLNIFAIAYANGQSYIYIDTDGTEITYYMDEDGLPYIIQSGQKINICLPLPQFIITDEELLAELNVELAETENLNNEGIMPASVPTNYFDLTIPPKTPSKSIAFSKAYSFENNNDIQETPIFHMNGNHSTLHFRTKSIRPLLASNKVRFVAHLYSKAEDTWIKYVYTDVNCTSLSGKEIKFLSNYTFSKFTLTLPLKATSYTAVIWTTYD